MRRAAEVARLTVSVLGLGSKPRDLAMDRANWKFGRTDLNVQVLSVAVNQVCVPLFWIILDKGRLFERRRAHRPDADLSARVP